MDLSIQYSPVSFYSAIYPLLVIGLRLSIGINSLITRIFVGMN